MELDWRTLRQKYPTIIYKSFEYSVQNDQLTIHFVYEIPALQVFRHELIIRDIDQKRFDSLDKKALDNLIFHIGMVVLLSYWKLTCSPQIQVKAAKLSPASEKWFRTLLINGMGQYFYENKIDFKSEGFFEITSDGSAIDTTATVDSGRILVPFSGGKDSTVTVKLLSKAGDKLGLLLVYPQTFAAFKIAGDIGVRTHEVENKIDHKLLDLNTRGFLNGHTPYSALLYVISILAAYLWDYKEVAFSNERGSSEGNTQYLGETINHQYSKTYEYERLFGQFNSLNLSNINVFSFLRPLYDIQISKIFSKYPAYFNQIRSCNKGQKDGVWCGKCAKCLSTYILLAPFINQEGLVEMFGKNLLEDTGLENLLTDLIGEKSIKPFECVGTKDELKAALFLTFKNSSGKLPHLLDFFHKNYAEGIDDNFADQMLSSWNEENGLNEYFTKILKDQL